MSVRMQAVLLRFLENGEIQAVGSDKRLTTVNVRVIAATNRNLPDLIAAGQFREDLLYRLRVIHLEVPPLRNRAEEIPALVNHFVARTHRRVSFTHDAMQVLCRYRWPGNVRELQNVVEQAAWLSTGDIVDVAQLPEALRAPMQAVRPTRERRGAGRRRVVLGVGEQRVFVLGSYLSAVSVSGYHPA
jgi:DNA-binding NtrC family response regulator